MRRYIFILLLLLTITFHAEGQYLLGFHTYSDDSFREWIINVEIDSTTEVEGSMEPIWGIGGDVSEWRYRVDDLDGEISQKFKNNRDLWELRSDRSTLTIKAVWPSDHTQWKISSPDGPTITIRTRRGRYGDEWVNADQDNGDFLLYTEQSGDARDWLVEDYMSDEISFDMRMAAAFIAIFSSL